VAGVRASLIHECFSAHQGVEDDNLNLICLGGLVGHLTTNAGSLAAGYAINWLAGTSDLPHSRFQYDLGQPEFGFKIINRKRTASCTCGKIIGHGDQADAAITKPSHWPRPLKLSLLRPLAR
jgi:hypothetical protein